MTESHPPRRPSWMDGFRAIPHQTFKPWSLKPMAVSDPLGSGRFMALVEVHRQGHPMRLVRFTDQKASMQLVTHSSAEEAAVVGNQLAGLIEANLTEELQKEGQGGGLYLELPPGEDDDGTLLGRLSDT